MTRLDKLFLSITNRKKEIRFSDLAKILKQIGYIERPGKGSHTVYSHRTFTTITLPKKNPVKRCYVEQVRGVLETYLGDEEK